MNDAYMNHKIENLKQLRRMLRLTQKEFLEQYYADEQGRPRISIATLSNLEAKGGPKLDDIIRTVSKQLGLDPDLFEQYAEDFQSAIQGCTASVPAVEETSPGTEQDFLYTPLEKKGNVSMLVNRLTSYFAERFYNGTLKKGDRIESDRELAVLLGVGRSAVREALKVLDVMGMIDIRPGQGTYIAESTENFFVVPLSWSMFLTGNQVDDILEVRNILQERAAMLAAVCRDETKLEKLHNNFVRIRKTYQDKDIENFLESDLEFHSCIAECSLNPMIYGLNQTISGLMRHVSRTGMDDQQLKTIYEEHEKIYGLIIAGDAEGARVAMREHLGKSRERYIL